jgi:cystathionine beta-lyase/cystathionine gamma-synthase
MPDVLNPEILALRGGRARLATSVLDDYVRLSIGPVRVETIIADLDRGFAARMFAQETE